MAACLRVGWRYWPMVRKSTDAARRSSITASTSSRVSPKPDHDARFGEQAGGRAPWRAPAAERVAIIGPRTNAPVERRHGLDIVVEHVGRRRRARSRARPPCAKSPASRPRCWSSGRAALMARTVAAKWAAPPSARSSRSTEVTTTWARPSAATALRHPRRLARDRARRAFPCAHCRRRKPACRCRPSA